MKFNEYTTPSGDTILYTGEPDLGMLDQLARGPGDIWHSGPDQGLRNAFMEIAYQASVFFWYVKDFEGLDLCVSWRLNPHAFAVRKQAWDQLGGFDKSYRSKVAAALDFAFSALRYRGAVVLYAKGLFPADAKVSPTVSAQDRHVFFARNFRRRHGLFMIWRKGLLNIGEWKAFLSARKFGMRTSFAVMKPRPLKPMEGKPTISYIIPTMSRQDYTLQLLGDLAAQAYLPMQVVVVDATPADQRDELLYNAAHYPFELDVIWQTSMGSCRARNEAIDVCRGDFIVFGDDDIRLPPEFLENHIRFAQTYGIEAANGLDVRAHHHEDGLDKLRDKLQRLKPSQRIAGAAQLMSNSNAFVSREAVSKIGGNDINYDGGYGEDNDFGLSLTKAGVLMLQNPYSANLHLKPPAGGYRIWGNQARKTGSGRKAQPWELDTPVTNMRPVPSPTIMYYFHKHFGPDLVTEYRHQYFFQYFFKNSLRSIFSRIFNYKYRQKQFDLSIFYATKLMNLGPRIK